MPGPALCGAATSLVKLGIEQAIKKYASNLVLGKTKSLEIAFFKGENLPWGLWYLRTRIEFAKELQAHIPVYHCLYVDVGAGFTYARTSGESLGFNSLSYPQFVHYGLMAIPKQDKLGELKDVTLRPDRHGRSAALEEVRRCTQA